MADEHLSATEKEIETPSIPQIRRKIPGNLPYTNAPGALSRALEKIPISEKPVVFTTDFLSTVLGVTGGSSRPIIPILKATGLLNQSGSPTEVYAQFQTEGGRAGAALQALKSGFAEIFKRNQFAHKADESTVRDIVVSVTGLPKSDPIVRSIYNTFDVFQKYARAATEEATAANNTEPKISDRLHADPHEAARTPTRMGMIYNINVVLPETTNVEVYNAIFRSLKGNLLQ